MSLTSKHVKALLRDKKLRDLLLKDSELSLKEYEDYDNLSEEKLDIANEDIFNLLEAHAPFSCNFPSPVEHLPDDATIYGTKGIYLLINQDGTIAFSVKKEALKYANDMSKVSFSVAESMGYL